MSEALTIMRWPIIACLLLPGILVYFGLHIVRRGIIFVDLALAQVAALGTCVCLVLGHGGRDFHTYLWSFGFTLVGAGIFTFTRSEEHHRVPQEALIGIVYVVAAALGIVILSNSPEGNEELRRTLIGDVLLVNQRQVFLTFSLYVAIGVVHLLCRKQFFMLSFDAENPKVKQMRIRWWDFLFYALFGVVVTTFLQIGGVLLVFSYLIIPAVCANFLVERLRHLVVVGWLVATFGSLVGLYISYKKDLPTGAAIVCVLGAILLLIGFGCKLMKKG